jgi:hypothetical protein
MGIRSPGLKSFIIVTAVLSAVSVDSSALADTACPTINDLQARVTAAKNLLTNGLQHTAPLVAAPVPGSTDVLTGIVEFVVSRADAEVEQWLINSVLAHLCTVGGTARPYFPNSCAIYDKTTGVNATFQPSLDILVSNLRVDATYAPACLWYREGEKTLTGQPNLTTADVDGLASLGYYYIAVAKGSAKPAANPKAISTVLNGITFTVLVGGDAVPISQDAQQLAALWSAVHAAEQQDYALALAFASEFFSASGKTSPELQQALSIAVALASAKDDTSVQAMLDKVASPVGAWASKEKSTVISITALPGVEGGRDTLTGAAGGVKTESYGFFLPIGLEVSHPAFGGGAANLLLSPMDAGALVSYAQSKATPNGTVQSAPTVSWKSVVAPGIYLAYSFHNTPFVLGVGYQRSPNLRSVSFSNGSSTQVPADRVLLFFSVDVTLFMHAL